LKRRDLHERQENSKAHGTNRRDFLKSSGLGVLAVNIPLAVTEAAPAVEHVEGQTEATSTLFSPAAKWIWDGSDRWTYHHYMQARRSFQLTQAELDRIAAGGSAALVITADAYYQARLNGRVIGAGPAKSAEDRRSVDTWDIASFLVAGENELDVTALGLGAGTMTYVPAEAGLIFELDVAGRKIPSGAQTLVRPDPVRQRRTARRWVLPCLEDVEGAATPGPWQPATVVKKKMDLYPRRVPLPTRQVLEPHRIVSAQFVRVPDVQLSMRIKPYLNDGEEKRRHNPYATPAYIVSDIMSPSDQTLELTPTLGHVTWYFRGKQLFEGSGWERRVERMPAIRLELSRGANRIVGLHNRENHFEDISLAGFADAPVEFKNPFGLGAFQVIRVDKVSDLVEGDALEKLDWEALRPRMLGMDPVHSLPFGNNYDLFYGSRHVEGSAAGLAPVLASAISEPIAIPPAPKGSAARAVMDLGVLVNGWIAFDVEGRKGSVLLIAMAEGMKPGPPLVIQWPEHCSHGFTYRLRDGRQSVETFFAYGVRYIGIQHQGTEPVRVSNVRALTANCGSIQRGSLQSDDQLVNSIYNICAQSVISGVDDTFTDCPTYEQVNWNFDNRTASIGDALTCANWAVTRNSIELFAEDPHYPKLVRSQYPSTWFSQIPMWSFNWILWCRDYYLATGDGEFTRRMFPRVAAGIDEAIGKIGQRGLLELHGAWHFVDWGPGRDDNHDIMSVEQAGLAETLGAGMILAEMAGGEALSKAQRWKNARESLIAAANQHLWDPQREAYFDSIHEDGSPSPVSSMATNAAMVAYGVAPDERAGKLAQRIAARDPQLLAYGSPYGLYYILEMFDRMGAVDEIFKLIRQRWGEMVLAGDTTTWETFSEWNGPVWPTRSRCHPFAAYILKYYARYLLGIESLAPGYAKVRVNPKPPQGMNQCSGSIPTPHGPIRVGWKVKDGKPEVAVELPTGIEKG
jgi:alpha-L-rhamnosidase